jgi:hypothetical protein
MLHIYDVWLERSNEIDEVLIRFDITIDDVVYKYNTLIFDLFFERWSYELEFDDIPIGITHKIVEFVENSKDLFVKNKDLISLLVKKYKYFPCGSFLTRYGI